MEIKKLSESTEDEILKVINLSFSDYIEPFHLDMEQLKFKIKSESINLNWSVGAYENNRLVGFIMNGIRKVGTQLLVYNAGTGVIPAYRRTGIAEKMAESCFSYFKTQKVNKSVLEVIQDNIPAINAYNKQGYEITRTLMCYSGKATINRKEVPYEFKELNKPDWRLFERFWDIQPSWQASQQTVENGMRNCKIIGAYDAHVVVGYLIYNFKSNKVYQIAVDKNNRRKGIGTQLIIEALKDNREKNLSVNNIDHQSTETCSFFSNLGLEKEIPQFEMEKIIGF